MTENVEDLIKLIQKSEEKWGILTGNGFNLSCCVKTDYQSLCHGLVHSFGSELTQEEISLLCQEFASKGFNFEVWISEKSKNDYMHKIALRAIHRQWLVEFVKACALDQKQYIFSDRINEFLNLFHFFFTLNVDPFFYRRCLARKEIPYPPSEPQSELEPIQTQNNKTTAKSSAISQNVFLGKTADTIQEVNASCLTKKAKKELGLIPEELEKPKEVVDGFNTHGNLSNREVIQKDHSLFYLHGACHLKIVTAPDGKKTMIKLKASDERSLISSIRAEDPDTNSAVFAGTSQEKLKKIQENQYLKDQLDAFGKIESTNLVIYGASLAENDAHIWNTINNNDYIKDLYISFHGNSHSQIQETAQKTFSNKKVTLFETEQFVAEDQGAEQ